MIIPTAESWEMAFRLYGVLAHRHATTTMREEVTDVDRRVGTTECTMEPSTSYTSEANTVAQRCGC